MMMKSKNEICVFRRRSPVALSPAEVRRIAQEVLESRGILGAELCFLFTDNREIRKYNRMFREVDRPTDIIAFPIDEPLGHGLVYLGDIIISTEQAAFQAGERGIRVEREIGILIIHGVLHLLGLDHETDKGEMRCLEYRLRKKILTPKRSSKDRSVTKKSR